MSGFDPNWLALREPVDHAARDKALLSLFGDHMREAGIGRIVDLGCGTGSTCRAVQPVLKPHVRWTLVDNDEALLEEAQRLLWEQGGIDFETRNLVALETLPIVPGCAVTASALFDLCSADFVADFAKLAAARQALVYAALTYDGVMQWSMADRWDAEIVAAFNTHQRHDKGFGGLALGPDAASGLSEALEASGYEVQRAESPWLLGSDERDLQEMFLGGAVTAVSETLLVQPRILEDWHRFRLSVLDEPGSTCTVGHVDLLAIPPALSQGRQMRQS